MQGNDIGVSYRLRYGCIAEGLLMSIPEGESPADPPKGLLRRFKATSPEHRENDPVKEAKVWAVNEMPMKSLLHLTAKLGVSVDVYTFLGEEYVPVLERWLARKGAYVRVYGYDSVWDLMDDLRFDREVQTVFTSDEEMARIIGMRATVVPPTSTWGH